MAFFPLGNVSNHPPKYEDEQKDEESYKYLTPGIGYAYFNPGYRNEFGSFSGIQVEYLLISYRKNESINKWNSGYKKVKNTKAVSPANLRWYTRINLLSSSVDKGPKLFLAGTGVDCAFENFTKRKWAIPVFGLELDFVSNHSFGNRFVVMPTIGLRLFHGTNLNITALSGYPFALKSYENYKGTMFSISADFSVW